MFKSYLLSKDCVYLPILETNIPLHNKYPLPASCQIRLPAERSNCVIL